MGSNTFVTTTPGHYSVEDAFRSAHDEDRYMSGNDGHTGDIGSVNGFIQHLTPQPFTMEQAEKYAYDRLDAKPNWDKDDPAEVIPFFEENPGRYGKSREKTVGLKLNSDATRWLSRLSNPNDPALIAQLIKQGLFKKGEIESVSVQSSEPLPPKVENLSTGGAAQTKYFISSNATPPLHLVDWSAGYTSMSDARTALNRLIESGIVDGPVNIVAKTARTDGSPLVQMKVTKMTKFTVKVTWRKELDAPTVSDRLAGWMFYGWARS